MQLLGISVTVQEALFSSIKNEHYLTDTMLENEISILMQGKQHAESTCNICMYQIYMAFSIVNDILLYNYHLRGILSDIWTQRLWSKLLHDFNTRSILHSVTIVFHKFLPDYFLFWKH